jgi:hypothetical protein
MLDLWLLRRSARQHHNRRNPSENLTPHEMMRLARWASAYHAETAFGAEDGKKWAFARYLSDTRRINEDGS